MDYQHQGKMLLLLYRKNKSLLWNTDNLYTSAFEYLTGYSFTVTGRTSTFQVGSSSTYNFCNLQCVLGAVDMKLGYVLSCFRCDYSQSSVKNFCSTAFEFFTGSWCWHTAKLLRTNWNKNTFFLQSLDSFLTFLWFASMPTTGNPKQTGTNKNRFRVDSTIKQITIATMVLTCHATSFLR